jgi:diguanylate cyclase (GGDEF)-like protein
MPYKLVNETLSLVERELADFLADLPDNHPYQMAMSLPYFRQTLKAKILSKIPNRHRVVAGNEMEPLSDNFFLGLLQERVLVEEKIRSMMPNLIQNMSHQQVVLKQLKMCWWVKIHTVIPCVTYFFGPFDSLEEAEQNHWGYIEDLMAEKAFGITFEFQKAQPKALTLIDSPLELKQDLQTLWQHICQIKSQQTVPQAFLESLPGHYLMTDIQGIIQNVSSNICQLLNSNPQEMIGKSLAFFVPQQQIEQFYHHLESMKQSTINSKSLKNWSIQLETPGMVEINVDIETTLRKNHWGEIIGWYWLLHDTTQLSAVSQQNYHDSRHDLLTSLPNRRSLFDFLSNLSQERQSYGSKLFSLLFLDLNGFKKINDRFGHSFGDQVLQAIAQRLLSCVRHQDKVTRLSGDEFAIILEDMNSPQEAKDCAYRIHHAISHPLQIGDEQVTVSGSIGIVISNGHGSDTACLFYYADMAMYESKRTASPYVIHDDVDSQDTQWAKKFSLDSVLAIKPNWEQNGSGKKSLNSAQDSL